MASVQLICEPIAAPERLVGNYLLFPFSLAFVRQLLTLRQRVHAMLEEDERTAFVSISLTAPPLGNWIASPPLLEDWKTAGQWCELPVSRSRNATKLATECVEAGEWMVEVGVDGIEINWVEIATQTRLVSPPLTDDQLLALHKRLAGRPVQANERSGFSLRQDLLTIANHYQTALAMSDSRSATFVDSNSDVVEFLWQQAELVRRTLTAVG